MLHLLTPSGYSVNIMIFFLNCSVTFFNHPALFFVNFQFFTTHDLHIIPLYFCHILLTHNNCFQNCFSPRYTIFLHQLPLSLSLLFHYNPHTSIILPFYLLYNKIQLPQVMGYSCIPCYSHYTEESINYIIFLQQCFLLTNLMILIMAKIRETMYL